ncbi:GNAT family N-acetyltransferase [Vibrio olivae]|uniref:GNAT family N-acetyltransferase n=1 Tax=Vibrio olivae TaxID=1243002 RepID=A0ABV5HTM9_9VIBR
MALSHHHSLNEILLRDIQLEDTELFYRLLSNPQVMTFSEGMLSREQVDAWLSRFSDDINAHLWVIELKASTQVIGYCSLKQSPYLSGYEVGYRLLPEFWGKGMAYQALRQVMDFAFVTLKLSHVFAQIDPNNLRSIQLAKRLGMGFEGEIKPPGYDYADHVWIMTSTPADDGQMK